MKAIILAAGRGSRMNEGTANKPKCLMQLCGQSLLDYGIKSLIKSGFDTSDIAIVTGYKKEMIQVNGVKYYHNANWANTNMFVSLTMAREWLISHPCIVCYADICYSANAVKKLRDSSADLAITYFTGYFDLWSKRFQNPLDDLETFKLDNGELIEIGQKPNTKEEVQGQYMGLIKFTPESWSAAERIVKSPLPKPVEKLDMTTLLNSMLKNGVKIEAIPTDDLWLECDNMNDIVLYEKLYNNLPNLF